jgi:hypothetical protein
MKKATVFGQMLFLLFCAKINAGVHCGETQRTEHPEGKDCGGKRSGR